MTDSNEDADQQNDRGDEFHITEPQDWEEPEVGADLPEKPPEPPEVESQLNPEESIEKSRQRIEEIIERQRTEPLSQNYTQSRQSDPDSVNTSPGEPPLSSLPADHDESRGRDHLDELDRRINIAKNSEDNDPAPSEEVAQTSDVPPSDASDQELVDQILEIHTDVARANEEVEGLDPVLEKLESVLRQQGIKSIKPCPGDEVDYELHRVIGVVDCQQPEGTVVELVRPGYRNSEHVIEEALVQVSSEE